MKKILIIGIDALRPDCILTAGAKNLINFMSIGKYSLKAQTVPITKSGSSWTSMLLGVSIPKHGVRGNDFSKIDKTIPSLFRYLKQMNPSLRLVSHVNWCPINEYIFGTDDLDLWSCVEDEEVAASTLVDIKNDNGDVFFTHFDGIDKAGHKYDYGPGFIGYLKAICVVDEYVGELVRACQTRSEKEDWFIGIVSDHGGENKKHGEDLPSTRTIFISFFTESLGGRGELLPPPVIMDMLPTISDFMGYPPLDIWEGRSLLT